ncbi:subtilisin-like protease [Metarhizium brunneum]
MVRLRTAVPLLAAAFGVIVSAKVVPGVFIFEFEDDQDTAPALDTVRKNGDVRMDLDFELFRGISVQLYDLEKANKLVDELAALPSIKRWWPVTLHNLHAKGYTGKGVHVAVIDTGIDYKHPSLGGYFRKGCLVTKGFDLVGDKFDGKNALIPDNNPIDCQGHGSHVTGIIAATDEKFGFTGEFPYVLGNPDKFDITLPLWVDTFKTSVAADLCFSLPNNTPDLSKYIVLIRRGTCSFAEKISNAAAKGAQYVLFYNSVNAYPTQLNIKKDIPGSVKGVQQLEAGSKVTVALGLRLDTKRIVKDLNNTASGGAFGAPGGHILSTYPQAKGSYAVISGTLMACPLIAAIYALLVEVFNDSALFYNRLAPVAQQGAGLIQAHDTAFATTLLKPLSLSFNETIYFAPSKNFTLTNQGDSKVTYEISYVPTLTAAALKPNAKSVTVFPGEFYTNLAAIRFSESKVTLEKGETATVKVLATPLKTLDASLLPVWSGYVRVNGTDGTSLSLPYQGLVGSLRNHTVLSPGTTYIAGANDKYRRPVAANAVFTIPRPGSTNNGALPVVVYVPHLGSRLLQLRVARVSKRGTLTLIGQIKGSPVQYVSRARDSLIWDGRLNDGMYVREGTYRIIVRMLRLYGDEKDATAWDGSETLPFVIRYA